MKNRNRIIAVTGMTGVGKDFLVGRAIGASTLGYYGWGDLLSQELGVNKDRMMTHVPRKRIQDGQLKVCKKLLELTPLVVTCHAIRPNEAGEYVHDPEVERLFRPNEYVFVRSEPEIIAERVRQRNAKGTRESEQIDPDRIAEVQEIKLSAMTRLANTYGCPLRTIDNTGNDTIASILEMRASIETIL